MSSEPETQLALNAVKKACFLCQQIHSEGLSGKTMEKQDNTPVTVADFAVQALISLQISGFFPQDPIMAEEHLTGVTTDIKNKIVHYVRTSYGDVSRDAVFSAIDRCHFQGGSSRRFWVFDPVDGTRGFLRGDQYAIALALIEERNVVLGVLGCPNLPLDHEEPGNFKGSIFVATLNGGTRMCSVDGSTETMINVSNTADITGATFCESYEPSSTSHSNSDQLAEFLGLKKPPIRMDSQCKYGLVARGDASIYLRLPSKRDYEEKLWDHAAGWLIVKEAGGQVSDIHNRPLDFATGRTLSKNKGIVATNGLLHSQVIAGIRKIMGNE